jgi:predicted HNH restriction endonuclease
MGTKLPYTPNSKIRQAVRLLWMRSRERSAALRAHGYCCAHCGVKQSAAKGREVKLDVHHIDGVDWSGFCDEVRRRILHKPERLLPLCESCHDKITNEDRG